ncbi:MAG: bifunctional diguanylate cyclase/phosphodiesterase [Gammaproteobacteria bacterium]|nr:bifunctional diguanylate cyclase/phosphodiesterase [Gammaproteobacteria bacterium]
MNNKFHSFLHQQILLMLGLSLIPGLGYIFLGWLHDVITPALIWYGLVLSSSIWGFRLYKSFLNDTMTRNELEQWYQHLRWFFYTIFSLWTLIFVLYSGETTSKLHYIAIFTQLGASVVASTLLYSDKKLYIPIILILMVPLTIYFAGIQEWYGYILCLFAYIFMGVLLYSATSSNKLLVKTYYQATHDQLTDLYNRNQFIDDLQITINRLKSSGGFSYLLLIDLDHFKIINDSLGHDIGDELLIEVSNRMKKHITKEHTLARLGGDEFIIIGPEYADKTECQQVAQVFSEKLLKKIKASYVIPPHHLYISASIGLNVLNDKDIKVNTFVKEADIAMYEAKSAGRDGVIIFNDDFSKHIEQQLEVERLLHFALEKNEIELKFQPQQDQSSAIIGCEVLVRWNNKKLGTVSPVEFIPIAEQSGVIINLGQYILEESFKILFEWEKKGIILKQFSINISMRQIFHHSFVDDVKKICNKYINHSLCSKIVFELTETIVAQDIKKLITIMNELKELGIKFSMDDFGTGYSSLSYITQLPIDELKIDRSFVSNLHANEQNKAMVSSILNLANTFNLSIVAEGVETSDQMEFLVKNNCNILQGYYFSKPISSDEFEVLYLQKHPS